MNDAHRGMPEFNEGFIARTLGLPIACPYLADSAQATAWHRGCRERRGRRRATRGD
jgi:hypothetical protein